MIDNLENTSYTIHKAMNGYTIVKSWSERNEKSDFANYRNETYIANTWAEVVEFLSANEI